MVIKRESGAKGLTDLEERSVGERDGLGKESGAVGVFGGSLAKYRGCSVSK